MEIVALSSRLVMLGFPVGHAYLWHGRDGLTLVDTSVPGSGPQIARVIEDLGYRPRDLRRILLTHFHEDHVTCAIPDRRGVDRRRAGRSAVGGLRCRGQRQEARAKQVDDLSG